MSNNLPAVVPAAGHNSASLETSSKEINRLIKLAHENITRGVDYVQEAILQISLHARAYDDCTGAARLINKFAPGTLKRPALVKFFKETGPIRFRKDKKDSSLLTAYFCDRKADNYKPFDIDYIRANKWYESEAATNEGSFLTMSDVDEMINKFVDQITRIRDGKAKTKALAEGFNTAELNVKLSAIKAATRLTESGAPAPQTMQ